MSKVMTFSRTYPSYHPKAGQPTHFVEKIWNSLHLKDFGCRKTWNHDNHVSAFNVMEKSINRLNPEWYQVGFTDVFIKGFNLDCDDLKHHTVRAGNRWRAGDWFRPVVWGNDVNPKSGRSGPYHSKQITFAPDIQVKKTWDFEMDACGVCSIAKPWEQQIYTFEYAEDMDDHIAANDGLTPEDFYWWFSRSPEFKKKKGFEGQIICWNENIEY